MGAAVRIVQERDASGAPNPVEFLQPIAEEFPKTRAQVVFEYLQPLRLERTSQHGVYRYVDPGRGSGWLRAEGLNVFMRDDLDRMIEVLVVSQRIGARDPHAQPEFFGQETVIRSSNPNIQIGIGVVFAVAGVGVGLPAFVAPDVPIAAAITLLCLGVGILGSGVAIVVIGARRLSWWRRARADVRARGERMPQNLQIFD